MLGVPAGPHAELSAQEFRVTAGNVSTPDSDLVGGNGWGYGVRYFHWEGLGFGIERDHYTNQSPLELEILPDGGGESRLETFDFTTRTNTTTFIVLLALQIRPDLQLRMGGGRSANVIQTRGVGRDSGVEIEGPDADEGRGPLAWSRGADGNLVIFEGTWELPIPSPVPVSLYGSYRQHDVTMSGCGEGFTPLCGPLNHRELQLGGHVHLFPRR